MAGTYELTVVMTLLLLAFAMVPGCTRAAPRIENIRMRNVDAFQRNSTSSSVWQEILFDVTTTGSMESLFSSDRLTIRNGSGVDVVELVLEAPYLEYRVDHVGFAPSQILLNSASTQFDDTLAGSSIQNQDWREEWLLRRADDAEQSIAPIARRRLLGLDQRPTHDPEHAHTGRALLQDTTYIDCSQIALGLTFESGIDLDEVRAYCTTERQYGQLAVENVEQFQRDVFETYQLAYLQRQEADGARDVLSGIELELAAYEAQADAIAAVVATSNKTLEYFEQTLALARAAQNATNESKEKLAAFTRQFDEHKDTVSKRLLQLKGSIVDAQDSSAGLRQLAGETVLDIDRAATLETIDYKFLVERLVGLISSRRAFYAQLVEIEHREEESTRLQGAVGRLIATERAAGREPFLENEGRVGAFPSVRDRFQVVNEFSWFMHKRRTQWLAMAAEGVVSFDPDALARLQAIPTDDDMVVREHWSLVCDLGLAAKRQLGLATLFDVLSWFSSPPNAACLDFPRNASRLREYPADSCVCYVQSQTMFAYDVFAASSLAEDSSQNTSAWVGQLVTRANLDPDTRSTPVRSVFREADPELQMKDWLLHFYALRGWNSTFVDPAVAAVVFRDQYLRSGISPGGLGGWQTQRELRAQAPLYERLPDCDSIQGGAAFPNASDVCRQSTSRSYKACGAGAGAGGGGQALLFCATDADPINSFHFGASGGDQRIYHPMHWGSRGPNSTNITQLKTQQQVLGRISAICGLSAVDHVEFYDYDLKMRIPIDLDPPVLQTIVAEQHLREELAFGTNRTFIARPWCSTDITTVASWRIPGQPSVVSEMLEHIQLALRGHLGLINDMKDRMKGTLPYPGDVEVTPFRKSAVGGAQERRSIAQKKNTFSFLATSPDSVPIFRLSTTALDRASAGGGRTSIRSPDDRFQLTDLRLTSPLLETLPPVWYMVGYPECWIGGGCPSRIVALDNSTGRVKETRLRTNRTFGFDIPQDRIGMSRSMRRMKHKANGLMSWNTTSVNATRKLSEFDLGAVANDSRARPLAHTAFGDGSQYAQPSTSFGEWRETYSGKFDPEEFSASPANFRVQLNSRARDDITQGAPLSPPEDGWNPESARFLWEVRCDPRRPANGALCRAFDQSLVQWNREQPIMRFYPTDYRVEAVARVPQGDIVEVSRQACPDDIQILAFDDSSVDILFYNAYARRSAQLEFDVWATVCSGGTAQEQDQVPLSVLRTRGTSGRPIALVARQNVSAMDPFQTTRISIPGCVGQRVWVVAPVTDEICSHSEVSPDLAVGELLGTGINELDVNYHVRASSRALTTLANRTRLRFDAEQQLKSFLDVLYDIGNDALVAEYKASLSAIDAAWTAWVFDTVRAALDNSFRAAASQAAYDASFEALSLESELLLANAELKLNDLEAQQKEQQKELRQLRVTLDVLGPALLALTSQADTMLRELFWLTSLPEFIPADEYINKYAAIMGLQPGDTFLPEDTPAFERAPCSIDQLWLCGENALWGSFVWGFVVVVVFAVFIELRVQHMLAKRFPYANVPPQRAVPESPGASGVRKGAQMYRKARSHKSRRHGRRSDHIELASRRSTVAPRQQ